MPFIKSNSTSADELFNLASKLNSYFSSIEDKTKCIEYLHKAAELDHIEAIRILATMYQRGHEITQDRIRAASLYQRTVNLGDSVSMTLLALMYKDGDGISQNMIKAIELFTQASEKGESNSTFNLAIMYSRGDGTKKDKIKSAELYQQAVDLKHPGATYNLALMYKDGDGIPQNKIKAVELFQQAVDLKDPGATYHLAYMYHIGGEIPQDKIKAAELFQQGVELNHANSVYALAQMYYNADGIDEDKAKAVKLYEKSAKLGYEGAQCTLAYMYLNGNNKVQDYKKAFDLFKAAAENGYANAIYCLGLMYLDGLYVVKDRERAADLLTQAAKLGFQKATQLAPHRLISELFDKYDELVHIKKHFLELEDTIKCIKQRHIYNDGTPLAHFTSWVAIENILSEESQNNNVLRLYNVDYMNDPTEGCSLLNLSLLNSEKSDDFLNEIFNRAISSNKISSISSIPPSIYSLSFTESSDRLDLWRAYGNDGDGFSIVTTFPTDYELGIYHRQTLDSFEEHKNNKIINEDDNQSLHSPILYRVFYNNDEKLKTIKELEIPLNKIKEELLVLDNSLHSHIHYVLHATLLEVMYLYKDEQYSTEREVRAIQAMSLNDVKLDERKPGRLYCETPPFLFKNMSSKIVIGPKVPNKQVALWNLRYRLNKNGFGDTTKVEFSSVQYR